MPSSNITQDELEFCSTFFDVLSFFNIFMPEIDPQIKKARPYQENILLNQSKVVVVKSARKVGKTRTLIGSIVHTCLTNPNKVTLVTTPSMAHLSPIFDKILLFFNSNALLKSFVLRPVRSPEYYILFSNRHELYGRIAGVGTTKGTGLLGIHCDFLYVDESQLYVGLALEQLQGCINPDCKIRVFGVPNGVKDSFLSKLWDDPTVPNYCKYKISRFDDPTFTEKENERLIRILGKDTPAYKNQVLAEDDITQNFTFNPKYYSYCFIRYDTYKIFNIDSESDIGQLEQLDLPIPTGKDIKCSLSADIGYDPDPTIIGIWVEFPDGTIQCICKFEVKQVRPTKQVDIINWLSNYYHVEYAAIDAGNIGKSIILDLDNIKDRKYSIIPINFGGLVPIGATSTGELIKQPVKFYSTTLLQEAFKSKKIILPADDTNMLSEVINSTQYKTREGKWQYSGTDHNLDMIRARLIAPRISDVKRPKTGKLIAFMDL